MKIETFTQAKLGAALAARVADDLRDAIASNGRASLAVPGGTTPGPFLSALSEAALDWAKVVVTLTDERQVPADHPRSNQALVSQSLLQNAARAATFFPLYSESQSTAEIDGVVQNDVLPLDVCVLGMGDDLHTASLFPGTPGLVELLDANANECVSAVTPPGADEPRVTLTVKALSSAAHTYVLIKGTDKRAALDRALQTDDVLAAPIRAILDTEPSPVIFYAE